MSNGVEFDEDKISYGVRPGVSSGGSGSSGSFGGFNAPNANDPKMVRWLMKKGIVKSSGAGQAVLILLVIINIAVTYWVITYFL